MKSILALFMFAAFQAHAALSAFPSYVSFNGVPTNGLSQTQSVTVQNSGPEIANPSVSNGCYGDFQVSNACFSIPVGGSCQISIRFAPSSVGYQSCSIHVIDNLNGSVVVVSVSGQGI